MNGQTLSPTCAHHIGIEKASNLVHILTALAISDVKLKAKPLGLSPVHRSRKWPCFALKSPLFLCLICYALRNTRAPPVGGILFACRYEANVMSEGHKKGTERRQARAFAILDLKPIFPSSSLTLKRHTLLGMPMVNVLSANNLDSFLLSTSSQGHTREMRGWVFATFARSMKGGMWIKNRALLAGNNRPPS